MNSGIYMIYNIINGKSYIGSTKNFKKRFTTHLRQLKKNNHHNLFLQRAYIKYGLLNFKFVILEFTETLFLDEQKWIDRISPEYNIGSVGGGDNISNHPNLDDIKQKQSSASKQRYKNMSNEEYNNYCELFTGNKNPNWKGGISTNNRCDECNSKISRGSNKCMDCSKRADNNPFYGKKHSDESKNKISKSNKGKKPVNTKAIKINDIIYQSKTDAARSLGVSVATICYRLNKKWPNYIILQHHI